MLTSDVNLIGVCFDGSGRPAGQSRAPHMRRAAGLAEALSAAALVPDAVAAPAPAERGRHGFFNEKLN